MGTQLDMVLHAAENTKERLEDFYRGGTMRRDDDGAVAQCIGAFAVFIDELKLIRDVEMPR